MGPELTVECAPGTIPIINRALSRIGVSRQSTVQITGVAPTQVVTVDSSVETTLALLHYGAAVNQTLRDFPWPFATKFNVMVPVGGTSSVPVNREWQYSYRRPGDCVFARRLVSARGGAVDPTPIPFEQGQDASGGLIFTNVVSATLEYTARPSCAAASVDALFREALTWKLAEALAVPLTRINERAKDCLSSYQEALRQAEAVLRPGKPGPKAATVTDTAAAVKLLVVNRALVRIGARTVAGYYTDESREAQAARLIFDEEYRSILQDFSWPFATVYATLALNTGTPAIPANGDWTYSYTLPTDLVFARRLVHAGAGRDWDPLPVLFRTAGAFLYTDEVAPVLEYTGLVSLLGADAVFRDALAWRLAASLAPSLARVDVALPEQLGRGPDPDAHTGRSQERPTSLQQQRLRIADAAWRMYGAVLAQAKVNAANQQQQAPDGTAGWIDGRT
ncbi:MAG TPA: hypothetical protein VK736_03820 [Candidatus Binatia bacterium]|nr:hypothetical protein [Candidatus Binatia bacterium]